MTVLLLFSDTGTTIPASCIFGQILDIGAIILLFLSCTRYLHLKIEIDEDNKKLVWANKLSLTLGVVSSIGGTIVGNFQVILKFDCFYSSVTTLDN